MSDRTLYPCGCASQGDQEWPCDAHAANSEPRHIHGADRRLVEDSVPLSAIRAQLEYWQRAAADLVRAINGTAIDFDGVTDPAATAIHDLQRERAAIRALVQQWREKAEAAYIGGRHQADMTFRDCADQLAALCPAPLEDRK